MSGTRSSEDSILDNIPGLEDQAPDTAFTEGGADDSGGGTSSAQPTGGSSEGRSSAQPTAGDGTIRRRHDGLVEVPNPQNPNTRDLVDPISGRTVAQGGIERRVFEEGQRHARENNQLKQQLSQLSQHVQGMGEVMQVAQQLNISPEQHTVALRVMADFVRDPVKTLEYLVSEVKSKGYSIPFLEQGVTMGMDMDAIARMIDNKLAPMTQDRQQQQQQQRQLQQAQSELNDFLSNNREAEQNLDVIAEMMQARPGLGLGEAYMRMIKWAADNGLNYTQSLKAQLAQRNEQQQPPQQQTTTRPLPGPRSAQVNGAHAADGGMYSENASWAEIIRKSMQESGIQLS